MIVCTQPFNLERSRILMFVLRSRLKIFTGLPLNPCGIGGLRRRDPRLRASSDPIIFRRLLSLIAAALLLLSPLARAQEGGTWTAYTSMRDIRDLLVSPDAVWAIGPCLGWTKKLVSR